jgi:hypothetical protein
LSPLHPPPPSGLADPPEPAPTPPARDPEHWLYRLTAGEWLAAAENELGLCAEALGRRAVRPGITHARRAAGMAWNAVLARAPATALDARYGRSYMEHLVALADGTDHEADHEGDDVPAEVRAAARLLRDTPAAAPALLTIGKPDLTALEAARRVVDHARARTSPPAGPPAAATDDDGGGATGP